MTITNINIRKITEHDKMKAIVSVTFDNEFVIHDIKVIKGAERVFIAMPSRRSKDGRFADIAHPITEELRLSLEKAVIDEYNRVKDI